MPLSSARESSDEHARAAVAATKPIHRIFVSIRAIANLHAAFATRAVLKRPARERSPSNSHENDLPGNRAVSHSRSHAALEIRGELVTTEKIWPRRTTGCKCLVPAGAQQQTSGPFSVKVARTRLSAHSNSQ